MRWIIPCLILMLPLFVGCGQQPQMKVGAKIDIDKLRAEKGGNPTATATAAPTPQAAGPTFVAHQEADKPPPEKKEAAKPRKIRYTTDLRVIVEDFDKSWDGLKAAMKEAKTEPAQEDINTSPGSPRNGSWRIRVPIDHLESFREAVAKLGDVERNTLQSEDMTAQYYDLEAHIANRNAEREAMRDLLKEVGKKDLKSYLEVKRELDSVTDDINRKEGQLRLWKNMTDLTTVTVNFREKQKFDAPKKVEDKEIPTFGMRADKTWTESWDMFLGFCQGAILVAIAVTPWLAIPLVLALVLWVMIRVLLRLTRKPALLEAVEIVEDPGSKKA